MEGGNQGKAVFMETASDEFTKNTWREAVDVCVYLLDFKVMLKSRVVD